MFEKCLTTKSGNRWSIETKASVAEAVINGRVSVQDAAIKYGMCIDSIYSWRRDYLSGNFKTTNSVAVFRKQTTSLDVLLKRASKSIDEQAALSRKLIQLKNQALSDANEFKRVALLKVEQDYKQLLDKIEKMSS